MGRKNEYWLPIQHDAPTTMGISLAHVHPDEDGTYNGLIYPPTHNKVLWGSSCISFVSGMYGMIRGYYDTSVFPLLVFGTSIMYWANPMVKSWRRYLDMGCVGTALVYHLVRAMEAEYGRWYYIITSPVVILYPVSEWYRFRQSWVSVILHGGIHLLGNIALMVLYSGYLPKRRWWW